MDEDFVAIGAVCLMVVAFVGGASYAGRAIDARMSWPGDIAKIEALRADVSRVDVAESEDVIGQVTDANQRIRSKQAMNQTWYADLLIPDGWDAVQPIQLPRR